jgi:Na+/H+ antiporter NhaA
LALDLRGMVNELYIALFCCVVPLEIRREMVVGALPDRRSALVLVATAVGTIVVIRIFSHGLAPGWLAAAIPAVGVVLVAQRIGIRSLVPRVTRALATRLSAGTVDASATGGCSITASRFPPVVRRVRPGGFRSLWRCVPQSVRRTRVGTGCECFV